MPTHFSPFFQDLYMKFYTAGVDRPPKWPRTFEEHLVAKTHPSLRRRAVVVAVASTPGPSSAAQPQPQPQTAVVSCSTPVGASTSAAPQPATAASVAGAGPASAAPSSSNATTAGSRQASGPAPLQFAAVGFDTTRFLAAGCVSALPRQLGIKGFQRFTMMKYFSRDDDDDDGDDDDDEQDPSPTPWPSDVDPTAEAARCARDDMDVEADDLWAYEGVVLPGGQVIVGRWWRPCEAAPLQGVGAARAPAGGEAVYSGPFVFWCVD